MRLSNIQGLTQNWPICLYYSFYPTTVLFWIIRVPIVTVVIFNSIPWKIRPDILKYKKSFACRKENILKSVIFLFTLFTTKIAGRVTVLIMHLCELYAGRVKILINNVQFVTIAGQALVKGLKMFVNCVICRKSKVLRVFSPYWKSCLYSI